MSKISYREIIEKEIHKVKKKLDSAKTEEDKRYWSRIIQELIDDFNNYYTIKLWRIRRNIIFPLNIEELLSSFYKEFEEY